MVNIINSITVTYDNKGNSVAEIFKSGNFYTIKLEKATFLSSYKTLLGYVKVTGKDPQEVTSQYYVNVKKIAEAINVDPSFVKTMGKGALESWVLTLQSASIMNNVQHQSQLKSQNVPNTKIYKKYTLDPEDNQILEQIAIQYQAYEGMYDKFDEIRKLVLIKAVSAKKLKSILNSIDQAIDQDTGRVNPKKNKKEIQRVLNTLFEAAQNWPEKTLTKKMYYKKIHRVQRVNGKDKKVIIEKDKEFPGLMITKDVKDLISYSYMINKKGQLTIFTDPYIGGTSKQIADKYCFSDSEKKQVRIAIRGDAKVEAFLEEQELKAKLDSPYIHNPKIYIVEDTVCKEGRKLIYLEEKLDGDGIEINNFKEGVQFALDYLRGLVYLHNQRGPNGITLAHCDIKPDNGLRIGKRAKVCDFGLTKEVGNENIGGSPFYLTPEKIIAEETDSFAYGILLLSMIYPGAEDYCNKLGKKSFKDLTDDERLEFFNTVYENNPKLSVEENALKLKLALLAKQLTRKLPDFRPLCSVALVEMEGYLKNFPGIDTSHPKYEKKEKTHKTQ